MNPNPQLQGRYQCRCGRYIIRLQRMTIEEWTGLVLDHDEWHARPIATDASRAVGS